MKKYDIIIQSLFFYLAFSLVGGQTNNPYLYPDEIPFGTGAFEQSILKPNRLQMNQGFSLMTTAGNGYSQTTGIYSNFSTYKLSERLKFHTGIHLIQNQNNLSFSPNQGTGLGYQFGLEYQLGAHSILSFQYSNLNNSFRHRDFSPFNAP